MYSSFLEVHRVQSRSPNTIIPLPCREDIKLEMKLGGPALTVIADSGRIEQVLMNLATNARVSTPDGGLLHIETESHA